MGKEIGSEQQLWKCWSLPRNVYVTKEEASNKYDASSPLFQHPKWYDVLSRGGKIASFVLEGQCTAAKGVRPLLSLIFWVRGTGMCLLGRGVVTMSAAQQGVLSCQPDQLQRKRNSPGGEGRGVGLTPSHCTYRTPRGLHPGLQRKISLRTWQCELGTGPKSCSAWSACVGRSQGQQETGRSRGLGLKM